MTSAGGYLVLDPAYCGYVLSAGSRFYTVVRALPHAPRRPDAFRITVRSPQFTDGLWHYSAELNRGEWAVLGDANPFVQLSLSATLNYVYATGESAFADLDVTILGANDFYSQPRDAGPRAPFAALGVPLKDVHKTGMGSSAAMVTSLCSALYAHWSQGDALNVSLLHNLSQYVHSLAQGKVGSGFDVSAAIWGSQVYRRFAVACLSSLLKAAPTPQQLVEGLHAEVWSNDATRARVTPFRLPPGLVLVLCDVDAGSHTPSMVSKVLAWRKAQPEASEALWAELQGLNAELARLLGQVSPDPAKPDTVTPVKSAKPDTVAPVKSVKPDTTVPIAHSAPPSAISNSPAISQLAHTIQGIRAAMKRMGELSGTPIEPDEQSELIDECVRTVPGVIGGGVPGAGGYDAIWFLAFDNSETTSSLVAFLEKYTKISVRCLSEQAWVRGNVADGQGGVVLENIDEVQGLRGCLVRL